MKTRNKGKKKGYEKRSLKEQLKRIEDRNLGKENHRGSKEQSKLKKNTEMQEQYDPEVKITEIKM